MNKPIYIHLREGPTSTVGASHWFGYPDLPPDVEVPMVEEDGERYVLTLISQINLADFSASSSSLRRCVVTISLTLTQ